MSVTVRSVKDEEINKTPTSAQFCRGDRTKPNGRKGTWTGCQASMQQEAMSQAFKEGSAGLGLEGSVGVC